MPGNLWFSDGVKKEKIELNWVNGILYKPSNAEAFNKHSEIIPFFRLNYRLLVIKSNYN